MFALSKPVSFWVFTVVAVSARCISLSSKPVLLLGDDTVVVLLLFSPTYGRLRVCTLDDRGLDCALFCLVRLKIRVRGFARVVYVVVESILT